MIHSDTHDPITDWQRCWDCHQGLSAAWAKWSEEHPGLGPNPFTAIQEMRDLARKQIAHGAAS